LIYDFFLKGGGDPLGDIHHQFRHTCDISCAVLQAFSVYRPQPLRNYSRRSTVTTAKRSIMTRLLSREGCCLHTAYTRQLMARVYM